MGLGPPAFIRGTAFIRDPVFNRSFTVIGHFGDESFQVTLALVPTTQNKLT